MAQEISQKLRFAELVQWELSQSRICSAFQRKRHHPKMTAPYLRASVATVCSNIVTRGPLRSYTGTIDHHHRHRLLLFCDVQGHLSFIVAILYVRSWTFWPFKRFLSANFSLTMCFSCQESVTLCHVRQWRVLVQGGYVGTLIGLYMRITRFWVSRMSGKFTFIYFVALFSYFIFIRSSYLYGRIGTKQNNVRWNNWVPFNTLYVDVSCNVMHTCIICC